MSDVENTQKPKRRRSPKKMEPGVPSTNGVTASARRKKKEELAEQLIRELRELRAESDELAEHVRLRTGGQIAELIGIVGGDQKGTGTKRLPAKAAAAMLAAVRERRVKPNRGRAKDLVKLQRLLRHL